MASLAMKIQDDDLPGDEAYIGRAMDEQDIFDCISTMLRQEEQYVCHDYMNDQVAPAMRNKEGGAIDESCRSKMCEWIFHVIDSTRLHRETASVAMGFLDRFLCSNSQRGTTARYDRKEYQLAAMTCLYIAVKIREPFEMDATLMSRLSRGLHSAEEITSLEYDIMIALQWKVNGPTPCQFVNYILELLPESTKSVAPTLYEHSHFQTELATGDYAFVPNLRESTIAVASILNSLGSVEQDTFPFNECIQFVRSISVAFDLDLDSPMVNAVRERLLESFAKSSGYELPQGFAMIPKKTVPLNEKINVFEKSPDCGPAASTDKFLPSGPVIQLVTYENWSETKKSPT